MIRKRTVLLALSAVCAGVLLVGCGAKSAGSPRPAGATESSEPGTSEATERPREIRLDGMDPCSLVPESDFDKYHFEKPGEVQESKTFRSPQCFYGTNVGSFVVTLVVTEGIEVWTRGGRNADVADTEPVEGFPAIFVTNEADTQGCFVMVDVADGQYLMADAAIAPSAESKVPEKCDYAHQLAESAMRTLVAS